MYFSIYYIKNHYFIWSCKIRFGLVSFDSSQTECLVWVPNKSRTLGQWPWVIYSSYSCWSNCQIIIKYTHQQLIPNIRYVLREYFRIQNRTWINIVYTRLWIGNIYRCVSVKLCSHRASASTSSLILLDRSSTQLHFDASLDAGVNASCQSCNWNQWIPLKCQRENQRWRSL